MHLVPGLGMGYPKNPSHPTSPRVGGPPTPLSTLWKTHCHTQERRPMPSSTYPLDLRQNGLTNFFSSNITCQSHFVLFDMWNFLSSMCPLLSHCHILRGTCDKMWLGSFDGGKTTEAVWRSPFDGRKMSLILTDLRHSPRLTLPESHSGLLHIGQLHMDIFTQIILEKTYQVSQQQKKLRQNIN